MEAKPTGVSKMARQVGEIRTRWEWVEPSVWTDRMLAALENGVKGGVWFSLIDKVWSPANLASAWTEVEANQGAAGVDRVSIGAFAQRLDKNLERLCEQLRAGTYRPQAVRRVWIPKAGTKDKRPLGVPTVRDRVVQAALRHVLEPIFEQGFAPHSYGFRPGRGCKDALRRVDELLKTGYRIVLDADLKSYFDTIPHDSMMERIREKVADGRVLALIESYLQQNVMDGLESWTPEQGTPQGAVLSPLLANLYLNPLDHMMAQKGFEMVRYADDFLILCRTRAEADKAREIVQAWTDANGLRLHPDKTRIVSVDQEGFDFLGYHFQGRMRWPRQKSLKKLKDAIRAKTRRCNGASLEAIIANVNRTLIGWFEYFKHSHSTTYGRLDQWIRMRLRSILRKRRGRRGRGRGTDHQRWPNQFFAQAGLFSLRAAWQRVRQPARR